MILAADVFGYSTLLQHAEEVTYVEFERLKRELICACPVTKDDSSFTPSASVGRARPASL